VTLAPGRIRFADYITVHWFPHHFLEASTRESYRYNLGRHILPWFGTTRMSDILPIHVREWVTDLIAQGVTPATIRHQKIILSAIFTTALNDLVISLHPCRGVKTPPVPVKEYQILSPDEITRLLAALPTDTARLLVEVAIESGLRWGELIELRPADLNTSSGVLTVSRAVVELHPDDHPDGGRFLDKPYPKSRRTRRFRLDPILVRSLKKHITARKLDGDDLLFHLSMFTTDRAARAVLVDADQLSSTEPNADGRTYRHGTCPPTPPAPAAAHTAAPRSPPTAPAAASKDSTHPAAREHCEDAVHYRRSLRIQFERAQPGPGRGADRAPNPASIFSLASSAAGFVANRCTAPR
jgi:integrase